MNILAIGAHYDDIELGCAGAIASYLEKGHKVYSVVITESDYSSFDGTVLRSKDQAHREGKEAAEVLGVTELRCLMYETKKVEYGVDLIERLNELINEWDIDTVITHWQHDVHQDHSAIGKASLNAARHCPRILMYRSNWYKSLTEFIDNFYIDISDYIDIKRRSILAHKTEVDRRGEDWVDFAITKNKNSGMEVGCRYAEAFQVVKWMVD
jgi:LmbE family N-acetylglucosaminyl deacetylase|tara:strand:- start:4980 stop:5612 length:633 start_codon:yes stop_codon:yes gene_type:complete